jgi:spermidine synthase
MKPPPSKRERTPVSPGPPPHGRHELFVLLASFLVGGAILVLEILGTRVIAPYYGASIYVWSSLIGVTLAALTLGYLAGGYAADRWPHLTALSLETVAAAVFVLLVPWMHKTVLSATTPLGLEAGALVSAAILFGPPLVLLGMTGPVSIRLVTSEFTLLGRGVGKIYGVSTLGSMLGAIATGFFLIPTFPVRGILLGVALTLLAVGAVGLFLSGRAPGGLASVTGGALLAALLAGSPAPASNLVHMANSFYGELKVVDAGQRRVLLINGLDNGFVDKQTFASASPYISYVAYLPRARPAARRALCIGLGVGSMPRTLHVRHGIETDVVEIDPQVVALARTYFGFPADIPVFVEDGRTYVERTRSRYDFVVLDAFASETHPVHLFTREFFASVDRILEPGGVLAINFVAFPYGEHTRAWRSVHRTVAAELPFVRIFKGQDVRPEDPDRWANLLLLASHESLPDPATLAGQEDDADILRAMAARELPTAGAEGGIELTDDYNPLDDLQRELFVSWRRNVIDSTSSVLLFDGMR